MNTSQDWQSLYRVALLETDWTKMEERVRTAESAISQRKRQLSLDHGGSPEENQSIIQMPYAVLKSCGKKRCGGAAASLLEQIEAPVIVTQSRPKIMLVITSVSRLDNKNVLMSCYFTDSDCGGVWRF